MIWEKIGRAVQTSGESTTYYRTKDGRFTIESRKRKIAHANGRSGFWWHRTYFLIDGDGNEKEYYSLKDAKEAAEDRQEAKA